MGDTPQTPPSVELLVVAHCPNMVAAQAQLRAILDEFGFTALTVQITVIGSDDEAVARGFTGSPSLRINGVDPSPGSGSVGMSCRLYRTAHGAFGLPDPVDVRAAIAAASGHTIVTVH